MRMTSLRMQAVMATSSFLPAACKVYQYDILGRITNVLANGSSVVQYGFDVVGNLQSLKYGNGVTNLYQYDAMNRLTNQVWKLNANPLASFAYTLGPTGNRTALGETVNGTSRNYGWAYDYQYRLTNETIQNIGTVNYAYDAVGNRLGRVSTMAALTNQSFIFNPNDWQTNTDNYDNNGSTIGSSGNTYQYDVMNHLTNVNSGSILVTYDGDGDRMSKKVGGTTTYYLVDDANPSGYAQVLEEYQGSSLGKVYDYGLDLICQRVPNTSTNYFIYDGHGSTRILTDAGGNVANTFAYDAYGTLIASNSTPQTFYLYCGQQFDPDFGFYYNRARYLNTGTGRFWAVDTYEGDNEDPLSLHKYLYTEANPVNGTDPSGYDDLGGLAVVEVGEVAIGGFDAAATVGAKTAVEVSLARSTAESVLLLAGIIGTALSPDEIPQVQYVVRGGIATPALLIKGSKAHLGVPGLTGFSVQSEQGKTVAELAKAGHFKNAQISVSTVQALQAAGQIAGYPVTVVKSPGRGFHCTVTTPVPLPNNLARVLSATFTQQPNPYPVQ